MKQIIAAAALVVASLALGACHHQDENTLTAQENAQLDNAADMLDASPDGLAAGNVALGNGEDADGEDGAEGENEADGNGA